MLGVVRRGGSFLPLVVWQMDTKQPSKQARSMDGSPVQMESQHSPLALQLRAQTQVYAQSSTRQMERRQSIT